MAWLDEVLSCGASAGECRVRVRQDAHYMGPNGMRPSSLIELIAQAYGIMSITHEMIVHGDNAKPLKRAFLAAFSDVIFPSSLEALGSIRDGDLLLARISGIRQIGPITAFHGSVRRGENTLCVAKMKIYTERG